MKIEKQVPILKQCQELKEIGIKQKSLFRWSFDEEWDIMQGEQTNLDDCSAFSLSELGVMLNVDFTGVLPEKYNKKEINAWFEINAKYYQSEAALRAGILLYLLKSGLLAVSTCNKRLLA